MEKSKKLENLATVMTLYSRRTFSKESFQWTKCVVKYLMDTYTHMSIPVMTFLVEVSPALLPYSRSCVALGWRKSSGVEPVWSLVSVIYRKLEETGDI